MRSKFTEKEIKEILNNMVIIIDTREQKNDHIVEYFKKHKIKYKKQKLDYGDYSCCIEMNENLIGILDRNVYFDKSIVIERKANIDELANNMKSNDRNRIKSEFAHLKMYNIKNYIFIEDYLYDKHIRNGNYRSQYSSKALYASLKALEIQYDTMIRPIDKNYTGSEIFNILRQYIKNQFEKVGYIDL